MVGTRFVDVLPLERARNALTATRTVETETTTEPPLALNEIGEVLRNDRRRMVVDVLSSSEKEFLELGNLAETIASTEMEKPPRELSSKERKRLYVPLYQSHLPKLDKLGVVEFDKGRKTIERGQAFRLMERSTEAVRDERDAATRGDQA